MLNMPNRHKAPADLKRELRMLLDAFDQMRAVSSYSPKHYSHRITASAFSSMCKQAAQARKALNTFE